MLLASLPMPAAPLCLFFMEMRRVEQDQTRQVTRGGCADDFALEAAFHQERNPAAVIEMRVGQKESIDRSRIEPKGFGVLLMKLPATLEHTAINQNLSVATRHQMT